MERIEDIPVRDGKFEYKGRTFDCSYLIERDKEVILREADSSHADTFDKLYDRNSLKAVKAKLNIGSNGGIETVMIGYTIDYKAPDTSKSYWPQNMKRLACGDYYPFYLLRGDTLFFQSNYQGSICW